MNAIIHAQGQRLRSLVRRVANRLLGPSATAATLSGLADLRAEIAETRREVARVQESVRSLKSEVAGQISFLAHDLGVQSGSAGQHATTPPAAGADVSPAPGLAALDEKLATLESVLLTRLNQVNQHAFEGRNAAQHINTSVHSRLNDLFFVQLPAVLEQLHQVAALLTPADGTRGPVAGEPVPRPLPGPDFNEALSRAERDFPSVYGAWKERLDAVSAAFAVTKEGNAAHGGDPYSHLFRQFVNLHARGPLLDVGCGPFGKPYYLQDCPDAMFAGLEPLPARDIDGLTVVRGISEYLPWPDQAFATVVSATSLDHCVSLETSLREVTRVLRPDGRFLLWIGSNPGSPPFRPLDPGFTPADQYHLFHFDVAWFEPMLAGRFETVDRVKLDRASYSHVFYCLRPLRTGSA